MNPDGVSCVEYTCDDDSARLVHVFHAAVAALGCNVWIEYVPSASNVADLPSRLDEGEPIPDVLRELGSTVDPEHPLVIPEIEADWRATFYAVYARLAPRPSRADKRHRRAVDSEVRRLLA